MSEQIFISCSDKDRDVADDICRTLEDAGRKCWVAPRDILPGGDWGEAIIDAINQSRLMILVYSDNANRSVQIRREIERAVSKGVSIVPFRIEDVPISKSLEYYLSTAPWLDAVSFPMEPHLRHLSEVVCQLMGPSEADGAARQLTNCAACDATIRDGETKCEVCGYVHKVPLTARKILPATSRHRKGRRWRLFRLQTRRAKISAVLVCLGVLSLGFYFGLRLWRGADKRDIETYFNQSMSYANNREFDKAIEEITKAITEEPSYALGYRSRGAFYFTRGKFRTTSEDFTRAVTDLEIAVKLNPRDDYGYFMLGQARVALGEFSKALDAFNAGLDITRNSEMLKGRGHILLRMQRYDQAIKDFTEAHELSPKDPEELTMRGYAYLGKKSYEAAIKDFSEAITINPSNPIPYKGKSEANKRLGNLNEAIEDDRQAILLSNGQH